MNNCRNKTGKNRNRNSRKLMMAVSMFLACAVIILVVITGTVRSSAEADTTGKVKTYTSIEISSGETLWSIAEDYAGDYGCSVKKYVKELKELNGLESDLIRSGSHLLVVYWSEV